MGNETEWRPGANKPLSLQIKRELEAIREHLGPHRPDESTKIVARVNRDGVIRFVTPTEVYSLAGDFAVRWKPLPDGTEDVTYWRDGVQFRRLLMVRLRANK